MVSCSTASCNRADGILSHGLMSLCNSYLAAQNIIFALTTWCCTDSCADHIVLQCVDSGVDCSAAVEEGPSRYYMEDFQDKENSAFARQNCM